MWLSTAGPFCFTSTEARSLIRDGDRGGRGRKSEDSTADTARKRPERPWTAARTMEVLRRCPLAIAQRLVHYAIAVSTAVLGQSHKDNVRCTAVEEQLEAKEKLSTLTTHVYTYTSLKLNLTQQPLICQPTSEDIKPHYRPHPTAAVTPSNASVHSHLLH